MQLPRRQQIAFRKDMLSKYIVDLVTGNYDEKMVKRLDKIAASHTRHSNKRSEIEVDYVHINALMGYVSGLVIGALCDRGGDAAATKAAVLAFNKLFWIQNDLFAQYYTYHGLEIADSRINVRGVKLPRGMPHDRN